MTETPAVDFGMYVTMLGSQASIALGLMPNPMTEQTETDLSTAKYLIDVLDMLKAKTEGNRTDVETKVLMGLLFDLRMKYVEASRTEAVGDAEGE
ncbi:MAG: DUF1844 domain-containing protein [Planctomycetota bacterium]